MTAARYLADTSAVVRILRKQAPVGWDELIERGQINICQAVEIEVLRASGGRGAYRDWRRVLFAAFPLVTEPEDVFDRARILQATLATMSQHQGPGAGVHGRRIHGVGDPVRRWYRPGAAAGWADLATVPGHPG